MADVCPTGGLEETCPRPSNRTIAFAICIVKSKPENLSIRDYILLLRQGITKDGDQAASGDHFAVDSYWRARTKHVENDLRAQKNEVLDLKREIDALKSQIEKRSPAKRNKKRKDLESDSVPSRRSQRILGQDGGARAANSDYRTDQLSVDCAGAQNDSQSFHISCSNSNDDLGATLSRNYYHLSALIKQGDAFTSTELEFHICQSASQLSQSVSKAVDQAVQQPAATLDLTPIFTASHRTAHLLIVGINTLCERSSDSDAQGRAVYAIVNMFDEILSLIAKLSLDEAKTKSCGGGERARTNHARDKTNASASKNVKNHKSLDQVVSLLGATIELLQPVFDAHHAIFEGFAYCVLRKLGTQLYVAVFGHERGPTVDVEIFESKRKDGVSNHTSEDKQLQVQFEIDAPYYIHLLKQIMVAAPSYPGWSATSAVGKARKTDNKRPRKTDLGVTAKERLQRTLIDSMFGKEGVDERDPFHDCLRMPNPRAGVIATPKTKAADMRDWFKEEIWRLLGWEILSNDNDLW